MIVLASENESVCMFMVIEYLLNAMHFCTND